MSFGWNLCNFGIMCYICTFARKDQGWISMWTQCHTMDFNVDTCKVSIQFPPESPPCVREINGERFGGQLFWMSTIKIAGAGHYFSQIYFQ